MNTKTALRLNGYSATNDGKIECNRQGMTAAGKIEFDRYAHERCAVIRIDLDRDSKPGRELVDTLLAAIDEPRALVGRTRNGSAVVLGRCVREISPRFANPFRTGSYELITNADGVRFVLTCRSEGATVDVDAYTWKGRSPLDTPREALAMLLEDTADAVVQEAYKSAKSAPSAEDVERQRATDARLARIRQEIADGLHSPEAIAAREDEQLAGSLPEDISYTDGALARNVLAARARIDHRKHLAEAAAA